MDTYVLIVANVIALVLIFLVSKKKSTNETPDSNQITTNLQMYLERINESVQKSNDKTLLAFMQQHKEMNQQIEKNFESAANRSLTKNVDVIQSVSIKGVEQCLKPLVSEIKTFEDKLSSMINAESSERLAMSDVLKNVSLLNKNFSEQAMSFTSALKGNIHGLGKFGEEKLKSTLEYSGYTQGHDYLLQQVLSTPNNPCVRPDCVLLLPGKRAVVVDSKLSLNSFISHQEATDENKRKEYSKELVSNIQTHVNELAKKEYQNIIQYESLPFVFMYMGSDTALTLALSEDNTLIRNSLEKGVLIVGPTTFLASLKTISFLWKEEQQKENFKEIAEAGKILYEKFKLFVDRMRDVQKNFEKSNEALETAFNHLNRGDKSLISSAQALKNLGVNTEKEVA